MSEGPSQVEQDRALITDAMGRGPLATLGAYVKLSGPGWLQSAITLGGGSLAGALFLGILGGTSLLWLQLVAIVMGVIMLSAISYVTLSTGERPFRSINRHINPVLGWGWIYGTIVANMIFCMPQFALCFTALQKNLLPGVLNSPGWDGMMRAIAGQFVKGEVNDSAAAMTTKVFVSSIILLAAGIAVVMNSRRGLAAKLFDWFLKGLVGIVVICFVGVVALMASKGSLDFAAILSGFIPDLSQWNTPTGKIAALIATLPENVQQFWTEKVVAQQRDVMIGAAATAVGINMTFLMPYSMLRRGWDRNFRGLSRFDLSTGMAIPYILVTSCVVIATASQFHAQTDEDFLSSDPATVQKSALYKGVAKTVRERMALDGQKDLTDEQLAATLAGFSKEERIVASAVVQRDAFELSKAISPLLGEQTARIAFGLGVFGMGFSTIIILMLINGFAFCEIADTPLSGAPYVIGCIVAGVSGGSWWYFWQGDSKVYLAIVVSAFAIMLLPIAYITFMMMMNSNRLLGDDRPKGFNAVLWNSLMGVSVLGAIVAAGSSMWNKMNDPTGGPVVITVVAMFFIAVITGFIHKATSSQDGERG
ncbi:MAG: divalent metal cation transporter [Planctomycetaceae bacterium]